MSAIIPRGASILHSTVSFALTRLLSSQPDDFLTIYYVPIYHTKTHNKYEQRARHCYGDIGLMYKKKMHVFFSRFLTHRRVFFIVHFVLNSFLYVYIYIYRLIKLYYFTSTTRPPTYTTIYILSCNTVISPRRYCRRKYIMFASPYDIILVVQRPFRTYILYLNVRKTCFRFVFSHPICPAQSASAGRDLFSIPYNNII